MREATSGHPEATLDLVMVGSCALVIGFALAGGLGILFNLTAASIVGWLGFAAVLLVAYIRA